MFWSQRKREVGEVAPHLTNGWTEELLRKVVPAAAFGVPNPNDDEAPHADHEIRLDGYGISLTRFETQRIFWGWITLGHRYPVPAYVRVDVVADESETGMGDRPTLMSLKGRDAGEPEDPDDPSTVDRVPVGRLVLNGHGGNWMHDGSERQKGMLPVFEPRLRLTAREWAAVHECLEVARWRDGRGPTLGVRVEFAEPLDLAELREKPWWRGYPITRYWLESVVALHPMLNHHPVFKADVESGSINRSIG